jgi:nitrite reductase (NO-forming)
MSAQMIEQPETVDTTSASRMISRRLVLRNASLMVGAAGAAAFLAACGNASVAGFTRAPVTATASPAPTTSSTPAATPAPSSKPGSSGAAPTSGSPVPSSTASQPSPSGGLAHDPSPPDFAIPPAYRPHVTAPVQFSLTSYDGPGQLIFIARNPDARYGSMNFDGQVPAPTLRVTEGDLVHFSLTNQGALPHSIDFHAAQVAWSRVYQTVAPGATASFDWQAQYPGVFMYHCGAPPVLMHIGDGMYGVVIVDPAAGRAPAREYVIVQSEFYGSGGDYAKMLNDPPDFVVFNGQANRYKAAPLEAKVGEVVRLFLVNAGPNSTSAFHVIGALFDHVEADGNPANAQGMRQTIEIAPGGGALVELRFAEPGTYPFVTHRFSDASKGATGEFAVTT